VANDLSQLDTATLISEARRVGIPAPEALDRDALIELLRGRDESARRTFSRVRGLLGKVVDTVRAVIPGNERRSDRPAHSSSTPPSAGRVEPTPRQAPVASPSARSPGSSPEVIALPKAAAALLADPSFGGVRVLDGAGRAIVWRVAPARIEATQVIAPHVAEMRLHTVRVSWPDRADAPVVERSDHGAVRSEGALAIDPAAPGEKLVVAIGLAAGDGEFVSIDHTTDG
jgi:hypothetical protein